MIAFFRKIRQKLLDEKSFSSYLVYALGEIVLVVIGILIALQINNWNEARKMEDNRSKNLALIKEEIKANQKIIKEVYYYHLRVNDSLKQIKLPKTEAEAKSSFSFWNGLRILRLQDAAFQTAVQSGSSKDFQIEIAEAINGLYTAQEAYNEYGATASASLYQHDFSDLNNFKQIATFLGMVMVDLYYFESELIARYEACLNLLETESKKE